MREKERGRERGRQGRKERVGEKRERERGGGRKARRV